MRPGSPQEPTSLDVMRIENVLWDLLRAYRTDFEITPISEIQDLRAFSILWSALFTPEAVSARFRLALARVARQYRDRKDFGGNVWFRVLPIEAALYVLNDDPSWLTTLLPNLDHHKSSLRTMTIESVALIANRLAFDADTLRRIAHNMEARHMFADWGVMLLAISKGTAEYKRKTIRTWLDLHEINSDEQAVVESLADGKLVQNPFLYRLLRTQQFLTLQLARSIPERPVQLSLDDDWGADLETSDQMTLFARQTADLSGIVWERIAAHPLTVSLIEIGNNPESPLTAPRAL